MPIQSAMPLQDYSPGQLVRRFRAASRPTMEELRLRRLTLGARREGLTAAEQTARARRRAGLTQEELVARCGLSVEGLRKIERDRVCPQPDTVRVLARALDLTPAAHAALMAACERTRAMRARLGAAPVDPAPISPPGTLP